MTGDAKITLGLIIVGVVVVIEDARLHYTRSLDKLRDTGENSPPPGVDARLDGVVLPGADPDLGAPPAFFSTLIGW
jgi:hypothetical protein